MPTATAQGKTFNFPEGTTPEQMGLAIDEFFASQEVSQEPTKVVDTDTFGSQLNRQMGLTVRAGVEGALALPAVAADALGQALSMIPGVDIPSTTQSISKVLTDVGVPVPETMQERIVGGAAKALSGVGGSIAGAQTVSKAVPEVATALTAAPGTQALSAVSGGTAAEVARESGAGPVGQTVAGIAGGVTPSVVGAVGGGARRLFAPTAAEKLKETAKQIGNEDRLINQLAGLGERGTLADVSPGFKGLAQSVVGRSPATRDLAESGLVPRTRGLSKRLQVKVSEILGKDGDIFQDTVSLLADRAAKARPLYKKAYSQPISRTIKGNQKVARKLTRLLQTDAVQRAIPRARRIASNEGRELPENLANANVQTWDDIKQGLDDVIQANTTEFGKLSKVGASVVKVKNQLLKILDTNKDYKTARDMFSGDSEMLNSLKFGGDIFSTKVSPSQARIEFNAMNPSEKEAALSGLAGAIKNQIGKVKEDTAAAMNFISSSNNKEKIASIIGKKGFDELRDFVQTEVTFRDTMSKLVRGSETQLRRAAEQSVNRKVELGDTTKANLLARAFGRLTGLSDSEALKLTRFTATGQGRFDAVQVLKDKGLKPAEIRNVLPALVQIEATQ